MRGTFASLHRNDFCPNTPCTAFLQQGVWLWTDNSSSTASVSNSATPFVPLGPKSTCGCSMGTRSSSNGGFRPTYRPLYVLAGVMSVLLLSGWSQHSCRDSSSIISLSLRHSSENSTPVIQPAALVLGNVDNSKQLGSPTVGSPPYRYVWTGLLLGTTACSPHLLPTHIHLHELSRPCHTPCAHQVSMIDIAHAGCPG
jgi:hypothetical protein